MELRLIDKSLLNAFRPYLLPEVAQLIAAEDPRVVAVGAVTEDHHTCAAAAALDEGGERTLFSLYVDPSVRRQGTAAAMLDELEERMGAPLTAAGWHLPEGDSIPVLRVLEKRGMTVTRVGQRGIMRLDTRVMRSHPMVRRAFSPAFRPDANVVRMQMLTSGEMTELCGDEEIHPALRPDRFPAEVLASPLSFGYRYGGRIVAYFLAIPAPDGASVVAAASRKGAHGGAFFQLAMAAINASLPYLPGGDGFYWIDAFSGDGDTMARYFCRDDFVIWREYRAERSDPAPGNL